MRSFARMTIRVLRAYKWAVSPLLPMSCRYVPTCSEYAMEAVDRYGVLRGGIMATWRLLRCHPLVRGGFDPVVKQTVFEQDSGPTIFLHDETEFCKH